MVIDHLSPLHRKLILIGLDAIAVSVAFILAILIQFPHDSALTLIHTQRAWIAGLVAVRLAVFFGMGLYDLIWKYASVQEVGRVVKAVLLGTLIVMAAQELIGIHPYSGRVLIIDWLITVMSVGGIRISLRLYRDYLIDLGARQKSADKTRVLIIGAGDGGEMMVREMKRNSKSSYSVVGFIDDRVGKVGKSIHQVPILGTTSELAEIVGHHHIKEAIIAIPSASGNVIRRIIAQCDAVGIAYKITPSLSDILNGQVSLNQLRNVNIEDLLGRAVIDTDISSISNYLGGARVLITGAGGSIGSEISRQIAAFSPKTITLVDHAETALYEIDMEILNSSSSKTTLTSLVANVNDQIRMAGIFDALRPTVVFHAAAYKHVPLMEFNPEEVILNNVGGTRTLLQLSGEYQVQEFVLISTDKAVRPTNAMGATKRLCEILLQIASETYPATKFAAVRFGNVLGSQGSVVPLFKRQIEAGGPVTVTHPEITRYFMTIPEAVRLVIQAGALANGGEVFILDMGEPVKVLNLARDLIQLSGKEGEIEIQFSGLRPGEKLYEELFFDASQLVDTPHKKIFVTKPNPVDLDQFAAAIDELIAACHRVPSDQLKVQLMELTCRTYPELEYTQS